MERDIVYQSTFVYVLGCVNYFIIMCSVDVTQKWRKTYIFWYSYSYYANILKIKPNKLFALCYSVRYDVSVKSQLNKLNKLESFISGSLLCEHSQRRSTISHKALECLRKVYLNPNAELGHIVLTPVSDRMKSFEIHLRTIADRKWLTISLLLSK